MYVAFDGVYCNSEVWLNGHSLGKRPNGYISFQYDLTPYLNANGKNVLVVKVDNSQQPNSRWYSGSGIYRNVWLVTTNAIHVDQWGTFVQTSQVSTALATVTIDTKISNTSNANASLSLITKIVDAKGNEVTKETTSQEFKANLISEITQTLKVSNPALWTLENPHLYNAVTEIYQNKKLIDKYITPFGIRYFNFDVDAGFSLNGKCQDRGVCLQIRR